MPAFAAAVKCREKVFGTPEEIASASLYLSSAESTYVVGPELVVDGGMSQL
jgi:NAD(P)-dependent dehydrogenase (short-subunit alcohol dehydrogenase family)